MKEVKINLIIWRTISVCYAIFVCLSILPIAVLLQSMLDRAKLVVSPIILIVSSIFLIIITLCIRILLVKLSSGNKPEVFRIKTNFHNEYDIISTIGKSIRLQQIGDNWWYGKEKLKRNLRVFIFSLHRDDYNNEFSIAERYVNIINEKTRFPTLIDKDMHQKMGRIQLFLYDEVPITIVNSVAENVENNIEQSEFSVSIYLDLSEGVLYIPYCRSRILGICRLYQYAVERFEVWLGM